MLKPNPEPAIIIAACTAAHRPTRRPAMLTDGRFDHTIGDGGFVLLVTMGDPPVGRTTAVARLGWWLPPQWRRLPHPDQCGETGIPVNDLRASPPMHDMGATAYCEEDWSLPGDAAWCDPPPWVRLCRLQQCEPPPWSACKRHKCGTRNDQTSVGVHCKRLALHA